MDLYYHLINEYFLTICLWFLSIFIAKVVKMLVTLVIAFSVCWLPINIFNMLVWLDDSFRITKTRTQYLIFVGSFYICHWLSMAHSFINPFIYCFMTNKVSPFQWIDFNFLGNQNSNYNYLYIFIHSNLLFNSLVYHLLFIGFCWNFLAVITKSGLSVLLFPTWMIPAWNNSSQFK